MLLNIFNSVPASQDIQHITNLARKLAQDPLSPESIRHTFFVVIIIHEISHYLILYSDHLHSLPSLRPRVDRFSPLRIRTDPDLQGEEQPLEGLPQRKKFSGNVGTVLDTGVSL